MKVLIFFFYLLFSNTGLLSDYDTVLCPLLLVFSDMAVTAQPFKLTEMSQVFITFFVCSFTARIQECGLRSRTERNAVFQMKGKM